MYAFLVTVGDYAADLDAQLLAAGFTFDDEDGVYTSSSYAFCDISVESARGVTIIELEAAKLHRSTVTEMVDALEDFFFADLGYEVEILPYATANPAAFFSLKDYSEAYYVYVVDIYGTTAEEMEDYKDALEAAGWDIADGDYEGDYVATLGDFGLIPCLDVQSYLDDDEEPCVEIVCYSTTAHNTAAQASQALETFYSEEYDIDIDLPDYATADPDAYFGLIDSYVEDYGVYLVNVVGSDLDELDDYLDALETAGWTITVDDESGEIAAVFGTSGECAVLYIYDHLDDGYIRFECMTTYVIAEVTAYSTMVSIVVGWLHWDETDIEDLGDGAYGIAGVVDAADYTVEELKALMANAIPDGFEIYEDWEAAEASDGSDGFIIVYYNEDADVAVEIFVYGDDETQNHFQFMSYPGENE